MIPTVFLVTVAALLFLAFFGMLWVISSRGLDLKARINPSTVKSQRSWDWKQYLQSAERIVKPLGEMVPRSPEEMSRQELALVRAGFRRKDALLIFYGICVTLVILLFLGFTATQIVDNPVLAAILSFCLGAMLPDLWLKRMIRSRQDRIQRGLPDVLDLTVVCLEAGLGLDRSLQRIGEEVRPEHPEISDELQLYHLEVGAGSHRVEALRNLARRTDVNDLRALVAVLIQTERFGTSIAQSLRVFAENTRTKRRQRAEEQAAKMTIKMVPPLILFFLPAMVVVAVGPAVIALLQELVPALSNR